MCIRDRIILCCSEMWRWGGSSTHDSLYRNPLVPLILACSKVLLLGGDWWAILYALALYGAIQAFSYGENAPIYKTWYFLLGFNKNPAEFATRATCGFLWSLPAIIFAILTGNWLVFAIYSVVLTIANAMIWYKIKNVEINERLVGAVVALAILV